MAKITAQQLREKYLNFFRSKGHTIIPSASLVPGNGASALFTMAGMFPLVPYLLGAEHPGGKRVANVQKCIRTVDIDEVGDDTHLTFFEMLGNWSFGDYFKKEAIEYSWEFLTHPDWLNLAKDRLAVSVFAGDAEAPTDEESAQIWQSLGVPKERIAYLPKADNWWIAGDTGPCGPDTEMFYWSDDGTPPPVNFQLSKNDKRWVEIWNDVFMQYEKKPDGRLLPLKHPNVDTGMGLDRTLAVLNGQRSVYDTELFRPLFEVIGLGNEILSGDEVRKSRIIVDHIRAGVFIVADGVEPSNKDRGYVLRRLLRRALVMARLLNLQKTWLKALIGQVITVYSSPYTELVGNSNRIFEVIEGEAAKFEGTLEKGLKEFGRLMARRLNVEAAITPAKDGRVISAPARGPGLTGKEAFDLYQTYGFPWELTKELAEQAGQKIDKAEFEAEFKKHQELSRTASAGMFKGGLTDHRPQTIKHHTAHHLLLAALRQILGTHVYQRGSSVSSERLRIDFSHPEKLTAEQLKQVEDLVNRKIKEDLEVRREEMPKAQAEKLGALAEFGAKYGDIVSVYTIYNKDGSVFSREFCGGPHVERTGGIGVFKVVKEEASSSGVRRIKAVLI